MTPGPWQWDSGRGGDDRWFLFAEKDEAPFAVVSGVDVDIDDIRLMAAAPEMLVALKELISASELDPGSKLCIKITRLIERAEGTSST